MKLKETPLDHLLFAGLLCFFILIYGFVTISEVNGKFHEFCNGINGDYELAVLRVFVPFAALGCGLGVLHLLSAMKNRK